MYWNFVDDCFDVSDQCASIVDQVAVFGYDCDTTLGQVDIDAIPFPPTDPRCAPAAAQTPDQHTAPGCVA